MIQDAMTQAGFMSGDGRYYELPGSGSEQVKNYPKMSNLRQPGMFAFRIGPTGSGNVILPDQNYQESLELNEVETCSNTKFPCVPSADCEAFSSGICCQCKSNYFGNGRSCLLNGKKRDQANNTILMHLNLIFRRTSSCQWENQWNR